MIGTSIMSTGECSLLPSSRLLTKQRCSFVDRDTVMRFHYGLGVGHVYSHEVSTPERPCSVQTQAENEHSERETFSEQTNWQAHTDSDDEEGEHIAVEELDPFQQERNGSTESLIEALEDMFTDLAFDYEN